MDKIKKASFYELIGVTYNWSENISRVKKDYRIFQLYFHQDKKAIFFNLWYEKLKNKVNEKFNTLYKALSNKIFKIFADEVKKIEKILTAWDKYDKEEMEKNETISKFYEDLIEVNKCINNKKRDEEEKWSSL